MDSIAPTPGPDRENESDARDTHRLIGTELASRYRVERVVAVGGFGVVYVGHDTRLQVRVAIKALRLEAAVGDTQRRMFEETFVGEARIVAQLRHPHIVRVQDLGVAESATGDKVPWMVMDWLEGRTLQSELARRRTTHADPKMSPAEAVNLLRPVIEAVAYAHEQRVVHRDIKPSNIMLVPAGRAPNPVVLDFGVAKAYGPREGIPHSGETVTNNGGPTGFTAMYAAREQITRARTGPWTDVHALALILCELLVGHRAYVSDDPSDILGCAFREPRPTPAYFGVEVGALEPVLERALTLQPKDRYENARAFLEALDLALGVPVDSGEPASTSVVLEIIDDDLSHMTTHLHRSESSQTVPPIVGPAAPAPSDDDEPPRDDSSARATEWLQALRFPAQWATAVMIAGALTLPHMPLASTVARKGSTAPNVTAPSVAAPVAPSVVAPSVVAPSVAAPSVAAPSVEASSAHAQLGRRGHPPSAAHPSHPPAPISPSHPTIESVLGE